MNILRWFLGLSLCLLGFFFFSPAAQAKNLYVNPSGCSDSTTWANNDSNNPWCTIGRAAWGSTSRSSPNSSQAAQAGDVVLISAGIYWTDGGNGRFDVALNPANNGTVGSPVTFRGEGLVYIRMIQGPRGPMIGCNGRNYIIWDNFQIDDYYGGSTSDTGPVHFGGNYCQLINSDIKGHPGSYYHGYATFTANYRGISFEYGHFNIIRNNRIYNFRGGQNEAGIMAYDSNDNLIENNEIYDNGTGVWIKGVHNYDGNGPFQERNIIRKNLLHGNSHSSIRVLRSVDAKVYQNVIFDCGTGKGLYAGFFDSTRSMFVNNTMHSCNAGILAQGNDLVGVGFYNNIISASTHAAVVSSVSDPSQQDVSYDRNIYFGNARMWCDDWGGNCFDSFAQFQSYGKDTNGIQADPLFVNAAEANFRLQASSPALTLGVDILDLNSNGSTTDIIPAGAYITGSEVIGISTSSTLPSDTTPPAAPTGLSII